MYPAGPVVPPLKPKFSKWPQSKKPLNHHVDEGEDLKRLVCVHYKRGCELYAPCCKKFYPCRVCHDEDVKDHKLDRKKVTKLKCRHCKYVQNEIEEKCQQCGKRFGKYVCIQCRLFDDDDSKKQFHCEKCGICRVGGKDNFFHCDTCGYCMNNSIKESHKCIPNASSNGCPVCLEDLHCSREGVSVPKCGHLIHTNCLKSMADQGLYRCPTCNASIMNMDRHWKHLDQEVRAWPMPKRYRRFYVEVLCNDCHEVSKVRYHIIGMKCGKCPSFNTRRTGQESPPDETDSEVSSESDIDFSDDETAEPFERHISQLLRTLSARVRALEGEVNSTDGNEVNLSQFMSDNEESHDPYGSEYTYPMEFYGDDDYSDEEDDDDDDSSDSWETESEEEVQSDNQKVTNMETLDGEDNKDSGFSENVIEDPVAVDDSYDQQDSSQGCSIM